MLHNPVFVVTLEKLGTVRGVSISASGALGWALWRDYNWHRAGYDFYDVKPYDAEQVSENDIYYKPLPTKADIISTLNLGYVVRGVIKPNKWHFVGNEQILIRRMAVTE